MTDFEIVWNGSHRDTYLCVEPWTPRDLSYVEPAKIRLERRLRGRPKGCPTETRAHRQARVLARLEERPQWPSNLLRGQVRMSAGDYYRTLMQLRNAGVIEWRKGRVGAVTRPQGPPSERS